MAAAINHEVVALLQQAGLGVDLSEVVGVPIQGLVARGEASPLCIEYADDGTYLVLGDTIEVVLHRLSVTIDILE
eukprot:10076759-Alexandrium_andersonii.AAC.1